MKKRFVLGVLAGIMVLGSFTGCNKGDGSSDGTAEGGTKKITYSVWLGKGEDSQYYSDYADNPILKTYLADKYTGAEEEEVSIALKFQVPPTGSEADNLSTLLSTGDYTDIIDIDFYNGTIADLYEEGIALDITEYVEKYMPNYLAYLEANPELALTATNIVDGEKKYLTLRNYSNYVQQWQGFEYRRDWIVKYGTNPSTGKAFTGGYAVKNDDGTFDTNSWEDDVVFPSGGEHPVYISDWEWMFEIFDKAIAAEGITDGYSISIPYFGYSEAGYLNGSFGGSAMWYKNLEDKIEFGGNSDSMRANLQCMNTWYKNGWLDTAFAEHTGSLPWRIDEVNVRQGKVGAWVGMESQFMNSMNTGDSLTKDIIVFSAETPINDLYGNESTRNVIPFCMYQTTAEGKTFVVTDKAEKKDMVALFRFIDTLYAEENAVYNFVGFSKEEYEVNQDEFYTRMGLTEGAYYDSGKTTDDGKKIGYYVDQLSQDSGNLMTASAMQRILGLQGDSPLMAVREKRTDQLQELYDIWNDGYTNTGILSRSFEAQLVADEAKEFTTIHTNVNEFMSRNITKFITGTSDPNNDGDWEAYVKALDKYNPARNTEIYQNLLDTLK